VDTNVIDIAGLVKTFGSVRALDLLVLDEPTSGLDPLMESVFRPLRPHGEEDTGRVEMLLATALSRSAWLAGHVAVTVVGTLMVLALAGAGPGTSYALVTGDGSAVARMTVELLMTAPAVLVLAGFARLLHGLLLRPRSSPGWPCCSRTSSSSSGSCSTCRSGSRTSRRSSTWRSCRSRTSGGRPSWRWPRSPPR
jgi:hypothetical protein